MSPAGNPGMSLIKLFLAGNTSALGGVFTDQGRKIPANTEIPKLFPSRKILISGIPDSRLVTGSLIKIFNGVQENVEFLNF